MKQAETQKATADGVVTARIPETYQWLLIPKQSKPQMPVEWQAIRLSGQDALAVRASKKLRSDELLVLNLAASSLRLELDKIPLWRGDHVAIRQLVEDFGRYHYLPRLRNSAVLLDAIQIFQQTNRIYVRETHAISRFYWMRASISSLHHRRAGYGGTTVIQSSWDRNRRQQPISRH